MQFSCISWNDVLFRLSKPGSEQSFFFSFQISLVLSIYIFHALVQKHFDLVWCRGTVRDKIFLPWMESLKNQGCRFLEGRKVTDLVLNEETGCINGVVCGKESFKVDALIFGVGISTLQEIVQRRYRRFVVRSYFITRNKVYENSCFVFL